jgi:hypothetical protein
MNTQKITKQNANVDIRTSEGAALVKGVHFNSLVDDVAANETDVATNAAAIATLEGNVHQQYSGALTDGAPTDAELDAAIGSTPAAVGAGWRATVIDTTVSSLVYLVVSDGTTWWYTALTAAV